MRTPPSTIGAALADIMTPALLVSLPALEANEARMRSLMSSHPNIRIRPHFKAQKSSSMAAWQLKQSNTPALGFCAQTVGEAAALLKAGCVDVLLTNSLPNERAAGRLAQLASSHPSSTVAALVDCQAHVDALEAAAAKQNVKLGALVEVECGQNRGGCAPASQTALELAQAISASQALTWGGLHVYHGAIQHVREPSDRQAKVNDGPAAAATSTVAKLKAAGIEVPCITGGGTGTLMQDLAAGTHNELQPGSYLFMDKDYGANSDCESMGFGQSLYVHASVVSVDEPQGKRVLDAGAKACDFVCGMPSATSIDDEGLAKQLSGTRFQSGGDEHGILFDVPEGILPVGSTVQLVPSHCDPTVNLHDYFVGVREGKVEALWEIDARGPG